MNIKSTAKKDTNKKWKELTTAPKDNTRNTMDVSNYLIG